MTRLELEGVSVHAGTRELLSNVSAQLEPGEVVALVGPNGAGKTTLLRTAIGLLRPSQGHARLDGRDVRRLSPRERAAAMAWLPQHTSIAEPVSVLEVVSAARFRFDESPRASERAAAAALDRVGGSALSSARVTELSGGERQRVAIATVLAQGSRLVLLDEPASHLDPAQQLESYRLLGELAAGGLGLMLVTHDVNLLGSLASPANVQVVGLARGRVAFREPLGSHELPGRLGELFGVQFAELAHDGRRLLLPLPRSRAGSPE